MSRSLLRARLIWPPLLLGLSAACSTTPSLGPVDTDTTGAGSGTESSSGPGAAGTDSSGPKGSESGGDTTGDPGGTTTGVIDPTTGEGADSTSSSTGVDVACAQARVLIAPGAELNVRPSPSTAEDPVGALPNAQIVDVLEEVEGQTIEGNDVWLHIETADLEGFISQAHSSCAVDACDLFDVPDAEYLMYGLHPDASDALVHLGITTDRVTQTIGSAAASAGTHAQDGTADDVPYSAATDLRVLGLSQDEIRQYIADLAAAGYAGWYRSPGNDGVPGDWSPHIHTVWVGAPMKLSLRNQVRSWMEGRNGLVSNTPYAFHEWPECVRDALWERYLEHNPADG